jgi:hypothetical protein
VRLQDGVQRVRRDAEVGGDLADAGVRGGDVEQLALALIAGEAVRLDLQGELGDLEPRERRRVAIGRRLQHGGSLASDYPELICRGSPTH